MTTNTGALTLERRPAMSDDERRILHEELHDARAVFETLGSSDHANDHPIIGAPVTLASDLDDGYSAHAAATADGKVCIATVKTPGTDGALRSVSYLHLEPAVLLMLAALVPHDVLARAAAEAGADIIELPVELAQQVDENTLTGQPLGGVIVEQGGRVNGECGVPGCTNRVEQIPGTDTWVHVPDGVMVPTHDPMPPAAPVVAMLPDGRTASSGVFTFCNAPHPKADGMPCGLGWGHDGKHANALSEEWTPGRAERLDA